MDESSFTGETTPCRKDVQPVGAGQKEGPQMRTVAFMGTFVCGGHGKVCACGCGQVIEGCGFL